MQHGVTILQRRRARSNALLLHPAVPRTKVDWAPTLDESFAQGWCRGAKYARHDCLVMAIIHVELEALREHKPPPIRRIRISDFGLPDPKRDPDRHQNCITWSLSHDLPLQKISSKSVHKFASNPTDKQTNRPNQKHNLLLRRR